jgi:hypothetical protein
MPSSAQCQPVRWAGSSPCGSITCWASSGASWTLHLLADPGCFAGAKEELVPVARVAVGICYCAMSRESARSTGTVLPIRLLFFRGGCVGRVRVQLAVDCLHVRACVVRQVLKRRVGDRLAIHNAVSTARIADMSWISSIVLIYAGADETGGIGLAFATELNPARSTWRHPGSRG